MNFGIAFTIVLWITLVQGLEQFIEDKDRFPGWKGALPNSLHVELQDSVGIVDGGRVRSRFVPNAGVNA